MTNVRCGDIIKEKTVIKMKKIICVILPLLLLLQLFSCGETVETDTVTETVTEAATEMDDEKNEITLWSLENAGSVACGGTDDCCGLQSQ